MEFENKVYRLDRIDSAILYELDDNSRQSLSQLSRQVRQGRDLVSYRFDRLRERGILEKCTALIDPYKLGYAIYRTFVRLHNRRNRVRELWQFLSAHPRIYWLAECHGSSDLMFSLLAESPREFNDLQSRILSRFSSIVLDYEVRTITDLNVYHKKFLRKSKDGGRRVGGTPGVYRTNTLEDGILRELAVNSRIELSELSEKLSAMSSTVRARIERLIQNGVIVGFRTELNYERIAMMVFKASIHVKTFRLSDYKRLEKQCGRHQNIIYYTRHIGDCPVELDIAADSYAHFARILDELREKNESFFRDADVSMIRRSELRWTI